MKNSSTGLSLQVLGLSFIVYSLLFVSTSVSAEGNRGQKLKNSVRA